MAEHYHSDTLDPGDESLAGLTFKDGANFAHLPTGQNIIRSSTLVSLKVDQLDQLSFAIGGLVRELVFAGMGHRAVIIASIWLSTSRTMSAGLVKSAICSCRSVGDI
jgi:hypothetical protein